MNITNSDYFTFNIDNTMFLTGQTGSGKSVLQDKLIDSLVKSHKPEDLQFVLLDMTQHDFWDLRQNNSNYIKTYEDNNEKGLELLDEMAKLSEYRAKELIRKPLFFICIEEIDMACVDQVRFETALMTINKNARSSNIKLILSTSRPSPDVVSKQLLDSFDLIVAGELSSDEDYKYLGVLKAINQPPYSFTIVENNNKQIS